MTVTSTSGGKYDNTAYNNIQFTSSGTGTSQTWSGGTVKLSATNGYCYAYYPYSSSASTITAIPVTAGGTDYMYASPVTVNDKAKNASLTMKHALSAIRFALKRGTYTGTGKVTGVTVASSVLGSSGTLNATTGKLTVSNKGTAVSQTASINLNNTVQNVDVVMVPSGSAGSITLSITIDGKIYSTTVASTTIAQGSCYTYTITVNARNLSLSSVKVGDWGYSDSGSPIIEAAGYTVMFAGNYSEMSFKNTVSGNTVTILACSLGDDKPKEVSVTGNATVVQSADLLTKRRTITLSDIASDVTVNFQGLGSNFDKLTSDGVYYIGADGDYTATASSSCIGVALINTAKKQRLMIEKYENANNAESTTIYSIAAQKLGSTETDKFSWGEACIDQSGITNYENPVGSLYGWLPKSDGSYHGSPELPGDPSAWTSGALSDFAGKDNSEIIKDITDNGTKYSSNISPMAYLMNTFNYVCPQSVNQGFHDWYIPSCGQLGLIQINKDALDNALTAIGGTAFTMAHYWSSSEYNSCYGWYISVGYGEVLHHFIKNSAYRVRLVRDL